MRKDFPVQLLLVLSKWRDRDAVIIRLLVIRFIMSAFGFDKHFSQTFWNPGMGPRLNRDLLPASVPVRMTFVAQFALQSPAQLPTAQTITLHDLRADIQVTSYGDSLELFYCG